MEVLEDNVRELQTQLNDCEKQKNDLFSELEKAQNIDDSLIRYLIVRIKKHDLNTSYFEKKD